MSSGSFLEKRTVRNFKSGTTIFKEGEQGLSMFILLAGQVEVSTMIDGKKVILAHLKQGDIFGEMALFGDKTRSATVQAQTDVVCHELNRVMFNKQTENLSSTMKTLFTVLVDRLKESNKRQSTISPEDAKRQVVNMINFFIEKDGEDHMDSKFVYFDRVADDIAFLTGIRRDFIERVMAALTRTELAVSKTAGAHERVFLVDQPEKFSSFAAYCRTKSDRKKDPLTRDMFKDISPEEKEVLMLLKRLNAKAVEENNPIREDIFKAQLEMQSGKKYADFATVIRSAADNEIIQFRIDEKKNKTIQVNIDQLIDRLQNSERISLFEEIEKSLGDE